MPLETEDLSCESCGEKMTQPSGNHVPKIIDCLHTWCSSCLQDPTINREGKISCPSCRSETPCAPADVQFLPNNFAVLRQLQLVAATSEPMVCDNCELRAGLFRCIQCAHFLCEECTQDHSRLKLFREHEVLPLDAVGSLPFALTRRKHNCPVHAHEELKLYCRTCMQLICRECALLSHPRPEHQFVLVADAGDACRDELNSQLQQTRLHGEAIMTAATMILYIDHGTIYKP